MSDTEKKDPPQNLPEGKKKPESIIKPWLIAVVIIAVLGSTVTSGYLIYQLRGYSDAEKKAAVISAKIEEAKKTKSSLSVELDTLSERKNTLAPLVVDWEERLVERNEAKAENTALIRSSEMAKVNQEELNTEITSLEIRQGEIQRSVEKQEAEYSDKLKQKKEITATLADALKAQEDTRREKNALDVLLALIKLREKARDALEEKIKTAQEVHAALKLKTEDQEKKLKSNQPQEADIDAKKAALDGLKNETQLEGKRLNKIKADNAAAQLLANDLQKKNAGLPLADAQLKKLTDEHQEKTAELILIKKELGKLQRIKADLADEKLAGKQKQLMGLLDEIRNAEESKRKALALGNSIKDLEDKKGILTRDNSQAETDLKNLKAEIVEQEKKYGELNAEIEKLERDRAKLKKPIDTSPAPKKPVPGKSGNE